MAYLISQNPKKNINDILNEVRSVYPRASPNRGFMDQLHQYQSSLNQ